MKTPKIITIDDVMYIKAEDILTLAEPINGMRYCILRGVNSGIHAGFVKEKKGTEVTLINTRRLWEWWGKTLSGLASEGTFAPKKCYFSNEIAEITILDVCEIIPCTDVAISSIRGLREWTNE